MRHPLRSNSRPWPITVSRKSDASVLVSVETSRVSCRLPGMAQRVGFESFLGCYCLNLSGAKSNMSPKFCVTECGDGRTLCHRPSPMPRWSSRSMVSAIRYAPTATGWSMHGLRRHCPRAGRPSLSMLVTKNLAVRTFSSSVTTPRTPLFAMLMTPCG